MNIKLLVLILILLNIGWTLFLEMLSRRSLKREIPDSVKDVYDETEYKKWRAYTTETKRFDLLSTAVNSLADIVLMMTNCYAAFARLFPDNIYAQTFSVILLSGVVNTIISIPFDWYATFVIEEKYGFNKSTVKTFILDQIKNFVMAMVLMTVLVSLFALVYESTGDLFIILFAVGLVLLGFLISFLVPVFTRLFNKFTPLEEGELKDRLVSLMNKYGYKVKAIEIMDASRRSTRMNAYFTGIGPVKRIVLFDTMVQAMSADQICAVFAHEMGHGLHHDMLRNQVLNALQSLVVAFAGWIVLRTPEFCTAFGFETLNYGFVFLITGILLNILTPLMEFLTSGFSRKAEYQADAQAVKEGYGEDLISALKLLAKNNLADLSPDPLLVSLTYSHPTMDQRITKINEALAKTGKD